MKFEVNDRVEVTCSFHEGYIGTVIESVPQTPELCNVKFDNGRWTWFSSYELKKVNMINVGDVVTLNEYDLPHKSIDYIPCITRFKVVAKQGDLVGLVPVDPKLMSNSSYLGDGYYGYWVFSESVTKRPNVEIVYREPTTRTRPLEDASLLAELAEIAVNNFTQTNSKILAVKAMRDYASQQDVFFNLKACSEFVGHLIEAYNSVDVNRS